MVRRISFQFVSLLVIALLIAVGCGDDDDEETDETGQALGTVPGTTPASPQAGQGNRVEVTLSEYAIEMPTTLPPGPTIFVVTNAGSEVHNFEVEGQGIEEEFEDDLQPGETKELQVTLETGEYEVYCPVDAHDELGMELELKVQ